LKIGDYVAMKIACVLDNYQFIGVPVSHNIVQHKYVMMNQMNEYFSKVQPSPFICHEGEVHFFKKREYYYIHL